MTRGYIQISRDMLDHPVVGIANPQWMAAWIWMLQEAAYKEKRVNIGGRTITLKRGQMAHSVRFMAEKLGWSKSQMHRFLRRLETETMIGTEGGTGRTVITICNYSKYQLSPSSGGTESGTLSGTELGQSWDKEEYRKYSNTDSIHHQSDEHDPSPEGGESDPGECENDTKSGEKTAETAPQPSGNNGLEQANAALDTAPIVEDEFEQWWQACPRKVGKGQARKAYERARKRVGAAPLLAGIRAYAALCQDSDREPRYIKHPATWLNGECWADEDIRGYIDRGGGPSGGPGPGGGAPKPTESDPNRRVWAARLKTWRDDHHWLPNWGPEPGEDGCGAPPDMVEDARSWRVA